MIIEYKQYLIKPAPNSGAFDLVKKITRNKLDKNKEKTGKKYEAEINVGYDMKLESCIQRIIIEELKEKEEVVDLQQFIKEYKKVKNEVLKVIKLD